MVFCSNVPTNATARFGRGSDRRALPPGREVAKRLSATGVADIAPIPDVRAMTDLIRRARSRLQMSNLELARQLEVSAGCVRSWDRHGPPRYARLAIAGLL